MMVVELMLHFNAFCCRPAYRGKAHVFFLCLGNSRLSEEMLEDGYLAVTNIDTSTVVIEQVCRPKGCCIYSEVDIV